MYNLQLIYALKMKKMYLFETIFFLLKYGFFGNGGNMTFHKKYYLTSNLKLMFITHFPGFLKLYYSLCFILSITLGFFYFVSK